MKNKVIAVIPAYNESKYIEKTVKKTKNYVDQIIVVDDASLDNTKELAEKAGALVFRHPINLGLGGTLKTGCEAAIMQKADIIVMLDGDGQHDPSEIPNLVNKIKESNFDLVIGSRSFRDMPLTKKFGNSIIAYAQKGLFNINILDTQSGFRCFRVNVYPKLKWSSPGYAVSSEILTNAAKKKLKCGEVEVKTIYNDKYKGTTPLDGMKIIAQMILWRIKA